MRKLDRKCDSDKGSSPAALAVRVAAEWALPLIGYTALFGACLSGYAGVGPWVIALTAIALALISRGQYGSLYRRGKDLGLTETLFATSLKSLGNGFVASFVVYVAGVFLRLT